MKKPDLTIPENIFRQLSELPDNRTNYNKQREKEIEAAIKEFYPQKSLSGIAKIFGVNEKMVNRIAVKLGKK